MTDDRYGTQDGRAREAMPQDADAADGTAMQPDGDAAFEAAAEPDGAGTDGAMALPDADGAEDELDGAAEPADMDAAEAPCRMAGEAAGRAGTAAGGRQAGSRDGGDGEHKRNVPLIIAGAIVLALAIAAEAWQAHVMGAGLMPAVRPFYEKAAVIVSLIVSIVFLAWLTCRNAGYAPECASPYYSGATAGEWFVATVGPAWLCLSCGLALARILFSGAWLPVGQRAAVGAALIIAAAALLPRAVMACMDAARWIIAPWTNDITLEEIKDGPACAAAVPFLLAGIALAVRTFIGLASVSHLGWRIAATIASVLMLYRANRIVCWDEMGCEWARSETSAGLSLIGAAAAWTIGI